MYGVRYGSNLESRSPISSSQAHPFPPRDGLCAATRLMAAAGWTADQFPGRVPAGSGQRSKRNKQHSRPSFEARNAGIECSDFPDGSSELARDWCCPLALVLGTCDVPAGHSRMLQPSRRVKLSKFTKYLNKAGEGGAVAGACHDSK